MQEMPFQRPKIQNISGGPCPRTPYNGVVTMASPSLKSWLRYWIKLSHTGDLKKFILFEKELSCTFS